MAEKEDTERRVYVLPAEQLERIRSYQTGNGIASEVEAVRRLLDAALQMRDSVRDILRMLKSRYAAEKDLRVLARDILTGHALVKSVHFEDGAVSFYFKNDEAGRIDSEGTTYVGDSREQDSWNEFPATRRQPRGAAGISWDAPRAKGGDLDDEIPF